MNTFRKPAFAAMLLSLRGVAGQLLAAACALGVYGNSSALNGPLLYDDKAAVLRNPVVLGDVPQSRVWELDFWGQHALADPASHKSWRPLVTLSYRLNYKLHGAEPFGYHCVNAAVHTAVTLAVAPFVSTACACPSSLAPALAAVLFAVHPVHVEAIQNIVGRAEAMMALLYMTGFLCFARLVSTIDKEQGWAASALRQTAGVGAALLFTLGATLCKETGVTLPALCVAWDVIVRCGIHPGVLLQWVAYVLLWPLVKPEVLQRPPALRVPVRTCCALLGRCAALGLGGSLICVWRLQRNGGSSPSFNAFETPAALHPDRPLRALSVIWLWAEYAWVLVWPSPLCCDWSYPSLPPFMTPLDARMPWLIAFVLACAGILFALLVPTYDDGPGILFTLLMHCSWCTPHDGPRDDNGVESLPKPLSKLRMALLMSVLAGALPFLLASNLVTTVGTTKAERLLYLPSLGSCMAMALLVVQLADLAEPEGRAGLGPGDAPERPTGRPRLRALRRLLAFCVATAAVGGYAQQCVWYTGVWTNGLALWQHAVSVQEGRPDWLHGGASTHALAELGMQLSWAGRHEEAARILERQIAICEKDAVSREWPKSGRLDASGYAPLSLVYRILGDPHRAVAIADRGLELIRRAASEDSSIGRHPKQAAAAASEAARCLAARALAVFIADQASGLEQMRAAVSMSATDAVVLALAQQMNDFLAAQANDSSRSTS